MSEYCIHSFFFFFFESNNDFFQIQFLLSKSWRGWGRRIHTFLMGICMQVNITNLTWNQSKLSNFSEPLLIIPPAYAPAWREMCTVRFAIDSPTAFMATVHVVYLWLMDHWTCDKQWQLKIYIFTAQIGYQWNFKG